MAMATDTDRIRTDMSSDSPRKPGGEDPGQSQGGILTGLRAVVGAVDDLMSCEDMDTLYRRAVEFCRHELGLERCAIFVERDGCLCGTYGTDRHGRTTDEHGNRIPLTVVWDGSSWSTWKARLRTHRPQDRRWVRENEDLTEWDGENVITIGTRPNGTNINLGCGSLYPEKMCAAVKDHGAQLGIALDGDADRVIVADELGNVVDGDQLLAIAAQYMKNQGALAHNTVVATVMSNLGLELFLRGEDIQMIRTAVGDRHVVAEMRRGGYNIGGEQSGHLIFTDHTSTGDGVIAALKTITAMLRSGRPLSELAGAVERVPQVLVNLRVRSKPPLSDLPEVTAAIASVEAELGDEGRVLVRYSGTEPKARVMIEGRDQGQIEGYAEGIADKLRKVIGE